MFKQFVKNNIILVSIVLFLSLFSVFVIMKPLFLFNKDGSIKQFGLGYSNKSVIPIWLLVIVLAIAAYFAVLYYLSFKKMHF